MGFKSVLILASCHSCHSAVTVNSLPVMMVEFCWAFFSAVFVSDSLDSTASFTMSTVSCFKMKEISNLMFYLNCKDTLQTQIMLFWK